MTSIVLILVYLYGGNMEFAVFNNGNPTKPHEFKTIETCLAEAEKQKKDINNILSPDATFVEFRCVETKDKPGQV